VIGSYATNTLSYDAGLCSGCGLCAIVCPHGVFALDGGAARVARGRACMECGACQRNCPTGAIEVESGVGCATALFYAALTGRDACCGPRDEPCCGEQTEDAARDTSCDGGERDARDRTAGEQCCGSDSGPRGRAADETRCCSGPAPKEDA